jgi:hypothetical protein
MNPSVNALASLLGGAAVSSGNPPSSTPSGSAPQFGKPPLRYDGLNRGFPFKVFIRHYKDGVNSLNLSNSRLSLEGCVPVNMQIQCLLVCLPEGTVAGQFLRALLQREDFWTPDALDLEPENRVSSAAVRHAHAAVQMRAASYAARNRVLMPAPLAYIPGAQHLTTAPTRAPTAAPATSGAASAAPRPPAAPGITTAPVVNQPGLQQDEIEVEQQDGDSTGDNDPEDAEALAAAAAAAAVARAQQEANAAAAAQAVAAAAAAAAATATPFTDRAGSDQAAATRRVFFNAVEPTMLDTMAVESRQVRALLFRAPRAHWLMTKLERILNDEFGRLQPGQEQAIISVQQGVATVLFPSVAADEGAADYTHRYGLVYQITIEDSIVGHLLSDHEATVYYIEGLKEPVRTKVRARLDMMSLAEVTFEAAQGVVIETEQRWRLEQSARNKYNALQPLATPGAPASARFKSVRIDGSRPTVAATKPAPAASASQERVQPTATRTKATPFQGKDGKYYPFHCDLHLGNTTHSSQDCRVLKSRAGGGSPATAMVAAAPLQTQRYPQVRFTSAGTGAQQPQQAGTAAARTAGPRPTAPGECYLCGSTTHGIRGCPQLSTAKAAVQRAHGTSAAPQATAMVAAAEEPAARPGLGSVEIPPPAELYNQDLPAAYAYGGAPGSELGALALDDGSDSDDAPELVDGEESAGEEADSVKGCCMHSTTTRHQRTPKGFNLLPAAETPGVPQGGAESPLLYAARQIAAGASKLNAAASFIIAHQQRADEQAKTSCGTPALAPALPLAPAPSGGGAARAQPAADSGVHIPAPAAEAIGTEASGTPAEALLAPSAADTLPEAAIVENAHTPGPAVLLERARSVASPHISGRVVQRHRSPRFTASLPREYGLAVETPGGLQYTDLLPDMVDTGCEVVGLNADVGAKLNGIRWSKSDKELVSVEGKRVPCLRAAVLTVIIAPNTAMEARWTGKVYLLPNVPCRLLLGTPLITHFNAAVQHAVGRFFYYPQFASGKIDLVAWIPVDTTGGSLPHGAVANEGQPADSPAVLPAEEAELLAASCDLDPEDGGAPLVCMTAGDSSPEEELDYGETTDSRDWPGPAAGTSWPPNPAAAARPSLASDQVQAMRRGESPYTGMDHAAVTAACCMQNFERLPDFLAIAFNTADSITNADAEPPEPVAMHHSRIAAGKRILQQGAVAVAEHNDLAHTRAFTVWLAKAVATHGLAHSDLPIAPQERRAAAALYVQQTCLLSAQHLYTRLEVGLPDSMQLAVRAARPDHTAEEAVDAILATNPPPWPQGGIYGATYKKALVTMVRTYLLNNNGTVADCSGRINVDEARAAIRRQAVPLLVAAWAEPYRHPPWQHDGDPQYEALLKRVVESLERAKYKREGEPMEHATASILQYLLKCGFAKRVVEYLAFIIACLVAGFATQAIYPTTFLVDPQTGYLMFRRAGYMGDSANTLVVNVFGDLQDQRRISERYGHMGNVRHRLQMAYNGGVKPIVYAQGNGLDATLAAAPAGNSPMSPAPATDVDLSLSPECWDNSLYFGSTEGPTGAQPPRRRAKPAALAVALAGASATLGLATPGGQLLPPPPRPVPAAAPPPSAAAAPAPAAPRAAVGYGLAARERAAAAAAAAATNGLQAQQPPTQGANGTHRSNNTNAQGLPNSSAGGGSRQDRRRSSSGDRSRSNGRGRGHTGGTSPQHKPTKWQRHPCRATPNRSRSRSLECARGDGASPRQQPRRSTPPRSKSPRQEPRQSSRHKPGGGGRHEPGRGGGVASGTASGRQQNQQPSSKHDYKSPGNTSRQDHQPSDNERTGGRRPSKEQEDNTGSVPRHRQHRQASREQQNGTGSTPSRQQDRRPNGERARDGRRLSDGGGHRGGSRRSQEREPPAGDASGERSRRR